MTELDEFVVKDALEIRDDILRTMKNGLIKQGVSRPDVGPNSDWFITATALGNELAVIGANAIIKTDAQMMDTAVDEDLDRHGAIYDREKQPASVSVGSVIIESSATSPIETGRQLNDSAGLTYEVTIGGNYENADPAGVPIRSISTGDATNHAEGDVLTWVSAPPFCANAVTVGAGGFVNGIDDEDNEVLRSRLFELVRTPPGAGNWQHVVEIAEESDPSVQKAFAYPAIQGPSTMHSAVVAAPTATNKSRVVADTKMTGIVRPYVKGKLPKPGEQTITTVTDVNVDIAFALSIPESPTASPPGDGGGWTNGTPWPAPDGIATLRHTVTVATSDTVFTIDAQTPPQANVTRIAWLSPFDWKLYTALVTAYSGSAGAYQVTVDVAFTGIAVGCYIWPECQNAQTYVDAILEQFSLMGPGEKTSNASALVRGFRHPIPATGWQYSVGPAMTRAVTDTGTEVLSAYYLHRTDGTTTMTTPAGNLTPQVPSAVADNPNQFVPRHIALYRAP